MRSGFVSLIGRPNVGKSTLLNTLINQKIAITSNKPQTTRNIIQGIYNEDGYQIVFVDTPGIHKPLNKLGKVLNKEAQSLTKDVDLVLFVVDAKEGLGTGDKKIIASLSESNAKVILVLNKVDKMVNRAKMLAKLLSSIGMLVALALPIVGATIAYKVFYFITLYDVYTSMDPENSALFLVLSILFPVTEAFFLFFNRNKDRGMPPRREAPGQEPWQQDNKDYV